MLTMAVFVGRDYLNYGSEGRKQYQSLNSNVLRISYRRLFCDKLITTRSLCSIALFTALALGHFAPLGLEHLTQYCIESV